MDLDLSEQLLLSLFGVARSAMGRGGGGCSKGLRLLRE
jgi:hypothetical protein